MQHDNFVRDQHSKAVINTDAEGLRKYKLSKARDQRLSKVEDDIAQLTTLVKQLIERIDGNQ